MLSQRIGPLLVDAVVDDTAAAARYVDAVFAPLSLLLRVADAVAVDDGTPTMAAVADDAPPPSPPAPAPLPSTMANAPGAPARSGDAGAGPRRVTRSLATTAWPVEPAVSAGFLLLGDAMVPWAGATAFAPLYFSAGPVVAGRVWGTSTGGLDVVEGLVGVGVGWQGRLGDARARASVVPGVLVSEARRTSGTSVSPDGTVGQPGGTGPLTSTAVMVPLELALPLGGGVSFTGVVEPTISTSVAYPDGDGVIGYARDRFFIFVGIGLDVGGPVD